MIDDNAVHESLRQENSLLRERIRDLEARLLDAKDTLGVPDAQNASGALGERDAQNASGIPDAMAAFCNNPQLAAIMDTIPTSVLIADVASRRLKLVNRRGRELVGFTESDVPPPGGPQACAATQPTGITIEAYHERIRPERPDGTPLPLSELPLYQALHGETIHNQELQFRLSDRSIPILASAAPLRDSEGRVISAVVVYDEFSERKQIEQTLQDNEARQSFLLRLSGALRPIVDPIEVQNMAARLLGEWLGASRAFYIIVEENGEYFRIDGGYSTPEAPLVFGRQRMASFMPARLESFRSGQTLTVDDILLDPELTETEVNTYLSVGAHAHVTVPMIREGRLMGLLAVHSVRPRAWNVHEVALIEQVAALTWAAVERAAAEKTLRDSEERFRIILENLSDGVTFFDLASRRYSYMSPRAAEAWGFTLEEMNDMSVENRLACVHPEDRAAADAHRRRAIAGSGQIETLEYRWQRMDGSYRWLSDRRRLVRDQNGRPLAVVGIIRDITQVKETERILQTAMHDTEVRTQELRTVIDSLPDGLTIYDEEIKPVFLNEPASRFFAAFGIQPDLPAAERIRLARIHGRDGSKLTLEQWPTYLTFTTGQTIKDFIVMTHPDPETTIYYAISTAPIRDAGGAVTGVVALVKDITERMQDEARLRASETRALALVEQLQEADQQKNRFISMLSHELRNPLAAITLSISLMEHTSAEDRHHRRAWDVIKRQSGQLTRLVDDLLDVTRITENRITLKKEPVELGTLIRRAMADYKHPLDDKGIALVANLPDEPVHLDADPVRITQVIGNLLSNAAKFTPKGGTVTIGLATEASGGQAASPSGNAPMEAVIRIADTGMGIKGELLEKLFQPFVQADTSLARRDSGLGLGLAIVKGMVDLHGGRIEAESAGAGHGTTFTIRLPIAG